jgi:hypothetical protein
VTRSIPAPARLSHVSKNFWVSFWFEEHAPKHNLEWIGFDKVLFMTDFPHPTSLYPGI